MHRAIYGRLTGAGHWFTRVASLACIWGHGTGHGPALYGGVCEFKLGETFATARRLDGDLPSIDGLPDVCHRDMAGLGLGATSGAGWRGRFLGLLAQREFAALGPQPARPIWASGSGLGYAVCSGFFLALGARVDTSGIDPLPINRLDKLFCTSARFITNAPMGVLV